MNIERFQKGGTWVPVRWQVSQADLPATIEKLKERFPDELLRIVEHKTEELGWACSDGLVQRITESGQAALKDLQSRI